MRSKAVALALATLLLPLMPVYAQTNTTIPVEVKHEAPPGIGEAVQRILNFIYWGGWVAVIGAAIYGAIAWAMGDPEKGRKYIAGAIVAAIVLAFFTVVVQWLIAG